MQISFADLREYYQRKSVSFSLRICGKHNYSKIFTMKSVSQTFDFHGKMKLKKVQNLVDFVPQWLNQVESKGFEPMTSALSKQRSKPAELRFQF